MSYLDLLTQRNGTIAFRQGQDFGVDQGVDVPAVNYLELDRRGNYAGGISLILAQGSYQANVPGVESLGRNLPDLALPGAVEDSFYDVGIVNGWATVGGTSWSAPAFNALLVEAAQIGGRRLGFANPAIYAVAQKKASRAFTDITQGNNTQTPSVPGFLAARGYDLVTGFGAPDGYALANALK